VHLILSLPAIVRSHGPSSSVRVAWDEIRGYHFDVTAASRIVVCAGEPFCVPVRCCCWLLLLGARTRIGVCVSVVSVLFLFACHGFLRRFPFHLHRHSLTATHLISRSSRMSSLCVSLSIKWRIHAGNTDQRQIILLGCR
jgi:hypothetical protein